MNTRVLLIVVYILMQHVIYGILGSANDTLWILYYHLCPVILVVGLMLVEMKNAYSRTLEILYGGIILVMVFYYLKLACKYEPEYLSFISNLNDNKAVYWTPIIFSILCLVLILRRKK